MSSASAAVRFPDGEVKFCIYNGTSDVLLPRLFDDLTTAWAAYRAYRGGDGDMWPEPEGQPEVVTIYSDYGYGWCWRGLATRAVVVEPLEPFVPEVELFDEDETPDWFAS